MRDYPEVWRWVAVFRDMVRQRRAQSLMNLACLTREDLHIIQKALVFWDQVVFPDDTLYELDMTRSRTRRMRYSTTGYLCSRVIGSYYDLTRAEIFAFLDCACDEQAPSGWREDFAKVLRTMATDATFPFVFMISQPVEPLEFMEWNVSMIPPAALEEGDYAPLTIEG